MRDGARRNPETGIADEGDLVPAADPFARVRERELVDLIAGLDFARSDHWSRRYAVSQRVRGGGRLGPGPAF
jgi:hypothetical protein